MSSLFLTEEDTEKRFIQVRLSRRYYNLTFLWNRYFCAEQNTSYVLRISIQTRMNNHNCYFFLMKLIPFLIVKNSVSLSCTESILYTYWFTVI